MYAVHVYFFYLKIGASCSISAALGRCSRSTPKINLRNSFVFFDAWEGKCFSGMTDLCPCWPPPCQVSTVKKRCVTLRQPFESKIALIAIFIFCSHSIFKGPTRKCVILIPARVSLQTPVKHNTSLITDFKNWHFWKPLFRCHVIQATQCCAFSAVGRSLVPRAFQFPSGEGN